MPSLASPAVRVCDAYWESIARGRHLHGSRSEKVQCVGVVCGGLSNRIIGFIQVDQLVGEHSSRVADRDVEVEVCTASGSAGTRNHAAENLPLSRVGLQLLSFLRTWVDVAVDEFNGLDRKEPPVA